MQRHWKNNEKQSRTVPAGTVRELEENMAKLYESMDFDIKLGNEPELAGASSEHDNAFEDFDNLP